jgi:tetratricopeptide (TPR) repeat protein
MAVKSVLCLAFLFFSVALYSQPRDNSNVAVDALCARAEKKLFTQPDSAFILARQALALAKDLQYHEGIANSLFLTGSVFFHQGFYQEALKSLLDAQLLFEQAGDNDKTAANLNQLGLICYNLCQPDVAFQRHQQALALYEKSGSTTGLAYTYGCLGRLLEKKQDYTRALDYQQKALEYYERVHDLRGMATILENIGSIHEDLEAYDTAKDFFTRALALNEQTNDSLSMIVNLNNLADGYRKTGRNTEAIDYTQRALKLALRLNDKYQVVSAYKDLGKVYNQAGQYREAYQNLEKGRTLYEEIYGEDIRRQVTLLQTLFDLERKNNEIQILEASRQLDSVIKISLVVGIVLLVLLGATIISRQRLKIRQDKDTIKKKESEQKLMQAELENSHLHEKQLQHALESKSKSLTAHTLHIISKNKTLEDIRAKLNETLQEDLREQRKKMSGLIKMIDHNFVQDKDWNDFRSIFEQVHQNFFDQLQKVTADLTSAEIRLAALIRLNLTSKDISTILGISPDSLRISRYRLRKKLALKQGESLTGFILSL